MQINEINLYGGKVIFWDLNLIDTSKSISEQLWEFKEDMALIKYPKEIFLDLGWCPSFKVNGEFTLIIVNDSDWENPIEEYHFDKIDMLKETLNAFCKKCYDYSR